MIIPTRYMYLPSRFTYDIPLTRVNINTEITGNLCHSTIQQSYTNNDTQLESVTYIFALLPNTTLTGMKMITSEKTIVGTINEKSKATTIYKESIESGHKSVLLESIGNDTYKVKIGLLKASENIIVEFTTVMFIEPGLNDELIYSVPTNIAPIYTNNLNQTRNDKRYSNNISKIIYKTDVPYNFDIKIHWTSKNKITNVHSLTNDVQMTRVSDYEIYIFSQTSPRNGDFNVVVNTENNPVLYRYDDSLSNKTYLYALCQFHDDDILTPNEYIFMLDRSGSMDGDKIKKAVEALELFVRSLPPNSLFNVVSFGTKYEFIWSHSKEYTTENMNECIGIIKSFSANMGGTDIFECLREILHTEKSEFEKVIVLLTDGQVSNYEAVKTLLESHKNHIRIFSVGIGQDASRRLVQGVANVTNGLSTMLVDTTDLNKTVISMLVNSQKTYYKDIKVFFNGKMFDHTKESLYSGKYLPVFIKLNTIDFNKAKNTPVIVEAISSKTNKLTRWELMLLDSQECPQYIEQLYAKQLVDKLSNNLDKDKIVDLCKEYKIIHPDYTSCVLVDETELLLGTPINVSIPHTHDEFLTIDKSIPVINRMNRRVTIVSSSEGINKSNNFNSQSKRNEVISESSRLHDAGCCECNCTCDCCVGCCDGCANGCKLFFSKLFRCFRKPQSPQANKISKTSQKSNKTNKSSSLVYATSNTTTINVPTELPISIVTSVATNILNPNAEKLVKFKKANGSFDIIDESKRLIKYNGDDVFEFNCEVYKYLTSLYDSKYIMIVRTLKEWLKTNNSTDKTFEQLVK